MAPSARQVLSVRIGEKHVCFAVTNQAGNELYQLAWCHTDEWDEKEWGELCRRYPALTAAYSDVQVAYDFSRCAMVPDGYLDTAVAGGFLQSLQDTDPTELVVTETIPEWQLFNVYALPKEIKEWMSAQYPTARFRHQFTLGLKNLAGAGPEGILLVDIREQEFTLMAGKSGRLLAAQTYYYQTPDDIVYYLLRVCRQFSLAVETVLLQLSGLIDKESALYKELNQYFIHTGFRDAGWLPGSPDFPPHFFTALNDLARCAS